MVYRNNSSGKRTLCRKTLRRCRWKPLGYETPMPAAMKDMIVYDATADIDKITSQVDFVFCAVDMKKDEIRALKKHTQKRNAP